jgi:hypothetical protein
LNIVKWWVDASFATHKDCRGHTGATMSLGCGSVIGISKKQKINTRSSTEAELVGVDDVAPQMMWTRYFMEEQGMKIEESVLHQDNLSAMLLQKNGKESRSKRTKHIRVRYFFIKDRITSGDITLKHCPATEMIADHFTKPLQGAMFRRFRAEIQGMPNDTPDSHLGLDRDELATKGKTTSSTNISPKECVGKEGIPAEPFTGYVRIEGQRARKEREGGLATSLLILLFAKKSVRSSRAREKKLFAQCNSEIEPSCYRLTP